MNNLFSINLDKNILLIWDLLLYQYSLFDRLHLHLQIYLYNFQTMFYVFLKIIDYVK